ncbi:MAG: hypothetical protein JKY65_10930 [Planctomycetes bacterium]|nr:hypothetical protein [Planctomycetota bacterium]
MNTLTPERPRMTPGALLTVSMLFLVPSLLQAQGLAELALNRTGDTASTPFELPRLAPLERPLRLAPPVPVLVARTTEPAAPIPLSAAETRYVTSLAEALRGPGAGAEALRSASRLKVSYVPSELKGEAGFRSMGIGTPKRPAEETRYRYGVSAKVGDVSVERLRFPNAEDAQNYALYVADTNRQPVAIEVRGRQVVTTRGEALEDPVKAAAIRKAAWDVLPHAPGAPTVAATYLSNGDYFLETRIKNEDLDSQIDGGLAAARKQAAKGTSHVQAYGDQVWATMDTFAAHIQRRKDGEGSVWVTLDPARADALARYASDYKRASRKLGPVAVRPTRPARATPPAKPKKTYEGAGAGIKKITARMD